MEFKMKCPDCASEFVGESSIEYNLCPSCNKRIDTNKAIKYYRSLNKIKLEKKTVAEGEKYAKVNSLLEQCKWFIDNGDYKSALILTDEALTLSNVDSRIYMMRVLAKTKNLSDYNDTTHYSDLKKALDLSPVFEKEKIREQYLAYYKKAKIPKEEMREYENQEATSRLGRVESLLKDSIPQHLKREKSVKSFWIFEAPLIAVSIILFVLSLTLQISLLSIFGAVIIIACAFAFIKYVDNVKNVKVFNGVLDIYDNLENFNLETTSRLNVSKILEKLAVAQINKETTMKTDEIVIELLSCFIDNNEKNAIEFILNHKSFNKYVKKEQD